MKAFALALAVHAVAVFAIARWPLAAPETPVEGDATMRAVFLSEPEESPSPPQDSLSAMAESFSTPPPSGIVTPVQPNPVEALSVPSFAASAAALPDSQSAAQIHERQRAGRQPHQRGYGALHGRGTTVQVPPAYRHAPPPAYPSAALKNKREGNVLLEVWIDAGGRPLRVTLKRGSGAPVLDEAAVRAVRHWEFEPARTGGVAVACVVEVPVCFRLSK